jgi:hypothetical protein
MQNPIKNSLFDSDLKRIYPLVGAIVFFLIMIYIWLESAGLWTSFPPTTSYYDWLATSFSHGQLSLEITPSPALLALPNPYDPVARGSIDLPADVSLYHGKYYLYFGPVPSILLAMLKPLFRDGIGDPVLVFAFITGILVIQLLLVLRIWGRFFPNLPKWTLLIGIVLIGLECPITSMLTQPDIHAASVAGGQFFLLGGYYFALSATSLQSPPIKNLVLAGIFWAAAVGTRATLLVPVGFMVLMVIFWIWRGSRQAEARSALRSAGLGFGLPIVLGLVSLGWYNWARFGSILELGLRYQLTWNDIHDVQQVLFSPVYILQNLFNYLLTSFRIAHLFPFIMYYYGSQTSIFPLIHLPVIYHPDKVVGLLISTPFILLGLLPGLILVLKMFRSRNQIENQPFFDWICVSLMGSALAAFIMLLFFFWNVERYLSDFFPALTLLSLIGFWQGYSLLVNKPIGRKLYAIAAVLAAIASISFSILLAISMGLDRYRLFNPDLIHWLRNSLTG